MGVVDQTESVWCLLKDRISSTELMAVRKELVRMSGVDLGRHLGKGWEQLRTFSVVGMWSYQCKLEL